jgi:ATP/maltotriose-dependent transcriptional regulator MalT
LERVYDVATRARLSEVDAELSRLPQSVRLRHPRALALRGMQVALGGDAPAGVALLRRAINLASDCDRPYFVELVVPLMITAGDIAVAEQLVDSVTPPAELAPAFDAIHAMILATHGHTKHCRLLAERALAAARASDNPMTLARVLQRVAFAAFYINEFSEAQERAIEAARAYERLRSYRNAAFAYSLLYAIAHGWGDAEAAWTYASRITTCAERSGDVSAQTFGLACQLGIALEVGDKRRFGSIRARLLANPLHEQYRERFVYIVADAVAHMWAGRFEPARPALTALAQDGRRSLQERSACDALIALCDAARGDADAAKRRAHLVLSRTAHHVDPEPLHEWTIRRIARIVAACTCIIAGETTRGRRALTRLFDPLCVFVTFTGTAPLDEAAVPPCLRGYARAINAAQSGARRNTPPCALTETQALILRMLCDGTTLGEIAKVQGRSRKTIVNHVDAIYSKLSVHNRTQAVLRARELGLL